MNWRDYGGRAPGEVGLSAQEQEGWGEQEQRMERKMVKEEERRKPRKKVIY